ncbi:MAG: radical SAM protein [Deltaproteobacteria bacterium]|nr:radical SAM protein [Deltaproteobacteria bacterium]
MSQPLALPGKEEPPTPHKAPEAGFNPEENGASAAGGQAIRRKNFGDRISFFAPGFKKFQTTEFTGQNPARFVTISLTGNGCALGCDHCATSKLKGMWDLSESAGGLFDLCAKARAGGARGVLISGGSDKQGRVPLLRHVPDMIRAKNELGLRIRVHPGVPDEATIIGLAKVGLDGAMMDIIGHAETIRQVYHLDLTPDDYEASLALLDRHHVPSIPHIILGLHYGQMLGEETALEIIARHKAKMVVLVVLTPLNGTPMENVKLPPLAEIGAFFQTARRRLPNTPVVLGCARPLGQAKLHIDKLALEAGFNGIAYPAEGAVALARSQGLVPEFQDGCCGVSW